MKDIRLVSRKGDDALCVTMYTCNLLFSCLHDPVYSACKLMKIDHICMHVYIYTCTCTLYV